MSALLAQASAHALPLRDGSVQCVVTSPPYWGLRAYSGEQSFAWGGDPEHAHEWGFYERQDERYTGKRKWQHIGEEAQARGVKVRDVDANAWGHPQVATEAFCPCGAWYGSLGLEPTPELYVEHMVAIFREVWRVLRPDGTAWLNLGDSYAGSWGAQGHRESSTNAQNISRNQIRNHPKFAKQTGTIHGDGLKPKDLIGVPWRVAFALQADGWWLRSDIVWSKPNPMPESATDRPTSSHEYVFLFTKSGAATFWTHRDGAGARKRPAPDWRWQEYALIEDQIGERRVMVGEHDSEPAEAGWAEQRLADDSRRWQRVNLWRGHDYFYDGDAIREPGTSGPSDLRKMVEHRDRIGGKSLTDDEPLHAANASTNIGQKRGVGTPGSRNARTVWTIATAPYPGAHFAAFPEKLVEPCVKAGSAQQACAECGAPWARVVERTGHENQREPAHVPDNTPTKTDSTGWAPTTRATGRVQPTCGHTDGTGRSVVLDPFCGTSTVGRVALRLGRSYVGLDLSREYLTEHSVERLRGVVMAVQEPLM